MKKMFLFALAVLSFVLPAYAATVVWHGSNPINEIDRNVIFDGKITMPVGTTSITADTVDVSIHLKHHPRLRNNSSGASILGLNALPGRTITVHVDEKVKFHSHHGLDFDIVESGHVVWKMKN